MPQDPEVDAGPVGRPPAVDVHQHLWPEQLLDGLRAAAGRPTCAGWTLHTSGEPPFAVDPHQHDVERRVRADRAVGVGLACVSLSAPLGIEALPPAECAAAAGRPGTPAPTPCPGTSDAWASVPRHDADPVALAALLADERFVGLQLPATDLLSPAAWADARRGPGRARAQRQAPVRAPRPRARPPVRRTPAGWWAPVVGYVAQLQAAWWGWQACGGRASFPTLRVLFAAGAGLAPVQHERQVARGGASPTIDRDVFVDSSSYGPQALDALVRCWASTSSPWAATGPTASRWSGCSGTPPPTRSGRRTRTGC